MCDPPKDTELPAGVDPTGTERFVLRLYVAGNAPKSLQALANVRRVCQEHLAGRFELEVIDVYQQPELAQKAQLVAVPTLIRRSPRPLRRITGDLSSLDQLLVGLEQSVAPVEERP